MFEKKVIVRDDSLIVGQTKIPWDDIRGIKEQNSTLLKKVSYRFPRVELFLSDGKVIVISIVNKFYDQREGFSESQNIVFEEVIKLTKSQAVNIHPDFSNHLPWRIILPIGIAELIAFPLGILSGASFDKAVLIMIFAGIISTPIGLVWERKKRKEFCCPPKAR